jgi:hypothetical protein
MKCRKLILSTVLLFGLGLTGLYAQESTTTAGGEASGSGGSASYAVGQIVYTVNTGTTGSVVQGVQQPFEISVVTGLEEAIGINLIVSAFPNPATDYLLLKVDASTTLSIQSMSYQLFDMQGKLIESKNLEGIQTTIFMSNLVPATYFLKIVQTLPETSQQEIKTIKIIKN